MFVGDELGECGDRSGLFFASPFERGFLIRFSLHFLFGSLTGFCRWEQEHQIWDRLFGGEGLGVEPSSAALIATEPPLNFPASQETLNEVQPALAPSFPSQATLFQVIFEDYGFKAALRSTPAALAAYKYRQAHPQAMGKGGGGERGRERKVED